MVGLMAVLVFSAGLALGNHATPLHTTDGNVLYKFKSTSKVLQTLVHGGIKCTRVNKLRMTY